MSEYFSPLTTEKPQQKQELDNILDNIIAASFENLPEKKSNFLDNNFLTNYWLNQEFTYEINFPIKPASRYFNYESYTFKPSELYPQKESYIFFPKKMSVTRASNYILGEGVLGRTWPSTGAIEILEGLYGYDFEEVLLHEILHNIYPQDNESTIRKKTKERIWFEPRWH